MAMGLTQPLTEMSTRNISCGVKTAFLHKSHVYLIRVVLSVPLPKYFLRGQMKKNEMDGACGTSGVRRGSYRVLVRKPEGKRPFGRPGRRWGDNMKMDLQEVGWIILSKDRNRWRSFVNGQMNLGVP